VVIVKGNFNYRDIRDLVQNQKRWQERQECLIVIASVSKNSFSMVIS